MVDDIDLNFRPISFRWRHDIADDLDPDDELVANDESSDDDVAIITR